MISDGEKWVAVQNLIHFEGLLKAEMDDNRCRILRELIEREREKLRTPDVPEK